MDKLHNEIRQRYNQMPNEKLIEAGYLHPEDYEEYASAIAREILAERGYSSHNKADVLEEINPENNQTADSHGFNSLRKLTSFIVTIVLFVFFLIFYTLAVAADTIYLPDSIFINVLVKFGVVMMFVLTLKKFRSLYVHQGQTMKTIFRNMLPENLKISISKKTTFT